MCDPDDANRVAKIIPGAELLRGCARHTLLGYFKNYKEKVLGLFLEKCENGSQGSIFGNIEVLSTNKHHPAEFKWLKEPPCPDHREDNELNVPSVRLIRKRARKF